MKVNIENIEQLQKFFNEEKIFTQFGLNRIGVFGSFSRKEKFNDIDIYIEEDISYNDLLSLNKLLTEKSIVPFDIVLKKFAEPLVMYAAKSDMRYVTQS